MALHRDNGPAVICNGGIREWYVDGVIYRDYVVHPDGYQAWYVGGKRHRLGGPAVIYPNGTQEYWVEDKRHRENGPAVIYPDGSHEYWVDGVYLKISSLTELELAVSYYKCREIMGT